VVKQDIKLLVKTKQAGNSPQIGDFRRIGKKSYNIVSIRHNFILAKNKLMCIGAQGIFGSADKQI
jgi:hypothetical protein